MATIRLATVTDIKKLVSGGAYLITDVYGDLKDWVDAYTEFLDEAQIEQPRKWFTFSGKEISEAFNINYPHTEHFLSFALDGLDKERIANFNRRRGDHWLNDSMITAWRLWTKNRL